MHKNQNSILTAIISPWSSIGYTSPLFIGMLFIEAFNTVKGTDSAATEYILIIFAIINSIAMTNTKRAASKTFKILFIVSVDTIKNTPYCL